MGNLLSKFFGGWIKPENMNTLQWFSVWFEKAKKVEEEGYELVVFKLPKNKNGVTSADLITQIEKMLQENKKIND